MAEFEPLVMSAKVYRVSTWVDGDDVKNLVTLEVDGGDASFDFEVDDPDEYRAALIERMPLTLTLDVVKLTPQY